jgi:hypothetical protein
MSIHEESTVVAERPMMAVFNNLVLFDQHIPQNSLSAIVPELGTDWAWQPPPGGQWGMPEEMLEKLPGYGRPNVAGSREEACAIMKKLGYGPDNAMIIKVTTRYVPPYRDPAVILIDQLKASISPPSLRRSLPLNGTLRSSARITPTV